MHYLSGRFTFYMSEQVSIMLHFELLQLPYRVLWLFVLQVVRILSGTISPALSYNSNYFKCKVWNELIRVAVSANYKGKCMSRWYRVTMPL